MNINSTAYYDLLFEIAEENNKTLPYRVKELKRILQLIASDYTTETSIQFPSLYARLDFIYRKEQLTGNLEKNLGALRFHTKTNDTINQIDEGHFYGYLLTVGKFIEKLTSSPIPNWFVGITDKATYDTYDPPKAKAHYNALIGYVWDKTSNHIIVDTDDGNQFKIPLLDDYLLKEYADTLDIIQVGDKLSLLEVKIDENDNCLPLHIVYQPDYLIDISAVAECFQNIGGNEIAPWQLFFIKRMIEVEASAALLKGNVSNYFMDELVYAPRDNQPLFSNLIKETFKNSPFQYTVLFKDDQELKSFIQKTREQFDNLKRVVQLDFESDGVDINKDSTVLEPAFINEKIGLQGRLDVLDKSNQAAKIIELKSGRLPWSRDNSPTKVSVNHAAQARMYRMMLRQVYNMPDNNIEAAICYSSATIQGENIRWVPKYVDFDKRILNTRNVIVSRERAVVSAESSDIISQFFSELGFEKLGIDLHPKLEWFRRDFDAIQDALRKLDNDELQYFLAFYQFVAQELMLSKIGDGKYSKGHAALWNKEDVSENDESDAIEPLKIENNYSDDEVNPRLILKHTALLDSDAFNFRRGDICVLYQKAEKDAIVTQGQIFKCSISKEIDNDGCMEVVFRYKQNAVAKDKIFNNDKPWCIEHDSLDHSFHSMFKSLFKFIKTDRSKRDLLLGKRAPEEFDCELKEYVTEDENKNSESRKEQNKILSEALSAKDYYLLIGPPGTGKTSIMLKHLVRQLHSSVEGNILVLAYTNRAVDEICESINNAIINFEDQNDGRINFGRTDRNFIRIGSRLGTATEHHHNLLDGIAEGCTNRAELVEVLSKHRVFVSTVSSIINKTELFKIKKFDTVIIDEASQILEPQLVGLLGRFKKFILIGDHKQLPAVSLQSQEQAKRFDSSLKSIGIGDLRESYFERMLRLSKDKGWKHASNMLSFQGRMHKNVATFPNHCFYGNKLKIAGLRHQTGVLPFRTFENDIQKYLGNRRLLYIPSKVTESSNRKTNEFEAQTAAKLVQQIIDLYNNNEGALLTDKNEFREVKYQSQKTIGIITPYRNQIALIKKELEKAEIPNWEDIAVDTVERYQGSQKDIIILSLCVNSLAQLEFLSANITVDSDTGELVDRKLNVALTRAKEQLILIGNPYYISNVSIYYKLTQFIKSRGGLIEEGVDGLLSGDISFNEELDLKKTSTEEEVQLPDASFNSVFNELVLNPIKDRSPNYPQGILGYDNEYNRTTVIGYGRANFDEVIITHEPKDRTLLYCYYNMRKHYFSQLAIFKSFDELFQNELQNNSKKMVFVDWGCGPCTAGIALQSYLNTAQENAMIEYVGIDISTAMLEKAESFLQSSMFGANFNYNLVTNFSDIEEAQFEDMLSQTKLCIFNFSYFFGNINSEQAKLLAEFINQLVERFPLNKYSILFQNSAMEKRNHSYNVFKRTLKTYNSKLSRREVVRYKNNEMSRYEKDEKVYFELLEL
ncbi:AAA domain-containing protein [Cellulophaga sp. 20_2_10]|uniref:AAA domain-containing protein n=1 Tax=Cellulophaga sp. 20_2_10 TaxID=2942476 RepID=UPI00201B3469|nr:AAA domain-containing protein [Cellulophaga sp. 20_2_10]MCL5246842.1 AAA domain-containing protein [Cellulophaga sp. 20_2_10]